MMHISATLALHNFIAVGILNHSFSAWYIVVVLVFVLLAALWFMAILYRQNKYRKNRIKTTNDELQQLKHEFKLLTVLANDTDNLVVVTNADGFIRYANPIFRKTFGLDKKEEITSVKIIDLPGFEKIAATFKASVKNYQNMQSEFFIANKKGRRFWLQVSISHALAKNEHKVLLIGTNINDLKYAEEEISQQSEDLKTQSEQLEVMNTELSYVNQVTTDSINYAQRIQYAILPRPADYLKHISESFVMFRPRDIVSGDFYWYGEREGKAFFVEADCTGHGVPGALMATIGNTLLNEIVLSEKHSNPAIILKELDRKIKSVLRQEAGLPEQQDGMDMALAQFDYETRELSLSIANQFVFLKHKGELIELEGSLFAIGGSELRTQKPDFNLYRFKIEPGDALYLFSDGYRDQFGEEEKEKMMYYRFKDIIEELSRYNFNKQKGLLEKHFDEWKGRNRQIDDILIWGIKF